MSERINVGDHVRIVIEGEYRQLFGSIDRYEGELPEGTTFRVAPDDKATIEKIEPPVTRFEPGDVVHSRTTGAYLALGTEGFLNLNNGRFFRYGEYGETTAPDGRYLRLEAFTSDGYDLVEKV